MMVEHDLELARQEQTLAAAGHKVVRRGGSSAWIKRAASTWPASRAGGFGDLPPIAAGRLFAI